MRIPLSEKTLFEDVLRRHAEQLARLFGAGQGDASS